LALDQPAAAVGQDRRSAGETRPLLLAALGGGASDETVVCQHVGADSRSAGSDGIGRTVQQENRFRRPRNQGCLRKLIEKATMAGVQDWLRAEESRLDHPAEEKCAGRTRVEIN
jgi:hypothetical protein